MPTSRSGVVLIGALVLYFFANQTQVGWLYVMCAVLAGTVLSAWWLSRSHAADGQRRRAGMAKREANSTKATTCRLRLR